MIKSHFSYLCIFFSFPTFFFFLSFLTATLCAFLNFSPEIFLNVSIDLSSLHPHHSLSLSRTGSSLSCRPYFLIIICDSDYFSFTATPVRCLFIGSSDIQMRFQYRYFSLVCRDSDEKVITGLFPNSLSLVWFDLSLSLLSFCIYSGNSGACCTTHRPTRRCNRKRRSYTMRNVNFSFYA